MKVFSCAMTETIYFYVEAESQSEASEWIHTHSIKDVIKYTPDYDKEYDEKILLDITDEENYIWIPVRINKIPV